MVHDTVRKRRERVRARRFVAPSGPASVEELLRISVQVWSFADVSAHLSIGIRKRLGIGFAQVVVAQLSASPLFAWVRKTRRRAVMKKLKRILLAMLVAVVVAAGAFAQKNSNDNRPPKDPQKVVERPKPPPSNSNNNSNRKKPG